MEQAFKILNKYRKMLTRQQVTTFKGQILHGDIEGFKKGLSRLLKQKRENKK